MYRHAEPVRRTHLSPFKTSRRSYSRWGASSRTSARYGATNIHSSSETSLGYGFRVAMTRCYRVWAKVHNTLSGSAEEPGILQWHAQGCVESSRGLEDPILPLSAPTGLWFAPISPKLVEGELCELPLYGVLRSSSRKM